MATKLVDVPEQKQVTVEIVSETGVRICRDDDGREHWMSAARSGEAKPGERITIEKIRIDPCMLVWQRVTT